MINSTIEMSAYYQVQICRISNVETVNATFDVLKAVNMDNTEFKECDARQSGGNVVMCCRKCSLLFFLKMDAVFCCEKLVSIYQAV